MAGIEITGMNMKKMIVVSEPIERILPFIKHIEAKEIILMTNEGQVIYVESLIYHPPMESYRITGKLCDGEHLVVYVPDGTPLLIRCVEEIWKAL